MHFNLILLTFKRPIASARCHGLVTLCIVGMLCLPNGGCVIHRHDARTGVHTLYGFGVMRVRTTPANGEVQAAGVRVDTAGFAVLASRDECGVVLGYDHRQHLNVFETPVPLQIEYTARDFWRAELNIVPASTADFPIIPPSPSTN